MRAPPFAFAISACAALVLGAPRARAESLALRLDHALRVLDPRSPPATGGRVTSFVEEPNGSLLLQRAGHFLSAAAGAPEDTEPELPERPPLPASSRPIPARPEEPEPAFSGVRWRLAPIRWRGQLATDLRLFTAPGQPSQFQQVESGSLQGSSYVYQPWLAQVAFGVTGLTASSRAEQNSRSNDLGGNVQLSVFPTSRYPFQASFDRSDSRTSDEFTGQEYTSQRIGVRQSYSNPLGDQSTMASFDRSTLSSMSFGEDTVDVWNLSHSRRLGLHRVEGSANRALNTRDSGDRSQFDRFFARHGYTSDGLLNIETLASYGGSAQDVRSGAALGRLRNESLQLTSFGTWRRADDDPLYVTGAVRFFQNTVASGTSSAEARSIMANANGSYRIAPNFMVNGGATVTQNSGDAGAMLLTSQYASAQYTPQLRRWGDYIYTSGLGANIANSTGGDGARQLVGGQATHAIQRVFELTAGQALSLNASEAFSATQDSESGMLSSLSHHVGASYRLTASNSLTGFASASASDSRSFGYSASQFQLVNLQVSGQGTIGRYSFITANYTVQGTRQGEDAGFHINANGGITYQHGRLFNVPQLRYLASYQRNDFQFASRQQGDLNAPREQVNSVFEQRLDYRIGRIEARLTYRLADVDGKKNALLFFKLLRQFGN